jgi:hypothetical protein
VIAVKSLIAFLERLDESRIHYQLGYFGNDRITVQIAVPGERWEIEFLSTGEIETEVFRSNGTIQDGIELIEELLRKHASFDPVRSITSTFFTAQETRRIR